MAYILADVRINYPFISLIPAPDDESPRLSIPEVYGWPHGGVNRYEEPPTPAERRQTYPSHNTEMVKNSPRSPRPPQAQPARKNGTAEAFPSQTAASDDR